jgi:Ca-activated chloride channel family protein
MTQNDFGTLKSVAIPSPSDGAKSQAIRAGLAAYREAQRDRAAIGQGSTDAVRLISTFLHKPWEWTMGHRTLAGSVIAGLIVFPIVAAVVWEHRHDYDRVRFAGDAETGPARVRIAEAGASSDPSRDWAAAVSVTSTPARVSEAVESPATALRAAPTNTSPMAKFEPSLTAATPDAMAPSAPPFTMTMGDLAAAAGAMADAGSGYGEAYGPSSVSGRDRFESFEPNTVTAVVDQPVSTFSLDVDTASYAFVRRMLMSGRLPPPAAVRVEEMINYFPYDYPAPHAKDVPFRISAALSPTPWSPHTRLLHIGIKGYEISPERKPRSNLVFLIDVSGSMDSPDKLPLVKTALSLLVDRLADDDSVAIVTYAGDANTTLEPTAVTDKAKILAAIDGLEAGGSTAGASGIRQAYALARAGFDKDGVNRVILATDGDFNVGMTDIGDLTHFIQEKRKTGIFLSVLGFGQGNYNDALMQALAQNGNGSAAYIDDLREAQKVLVEEASSTLFPIAKDVKVQIEFNPALVAEYRLIGYETRALARADFNNDRVDAGDVSSGHTVTAIYEITPAGSPYKLVGDLRYQGPQEAVYNGHPDEYALLQLRYKLPREDTSRLISLPITSDSIRQSVDGLSDDMRFAAAVAAFGQKLQGNPELDDFGYDEILALAASARGADDQGYRAEFMTLVRLAGSLSDAEAKRGQ